MSEKKVNIKGIILKWFLSYFAVLLIVFGTIFLIAEEGERKKLWTEIMLWVHFGVFVSLYIKYIKKPFVNILKGQGNKISEQLKNVEADLKEARSRMEAEADKLKNMDNNLASITESIIAAGAREKESIIERAQTLADKMISDAKKEAGFKMLAAKQRFSEEMLEAAIKISAESITRNITSEDDEKLVNAFSSSLGSEQNIIA
ncbi:MAG: hypothetical protein PVG39_05355 [Desulfobacteraceae bacterium]